MPVAQFFRKPKGLLILVFLVLVVIAGLASGFAAIAPGLLSAMAAAAIADAPVLRLREGKWSFPDGALLTGMIVGMILSPATPWHVGAVTSVIAIASKHLFRSGRANIFNPAALALIVTYYIYFPGQDWWGSLPESTPYALAVLVATGLFITERVNKLPLLLAFLGSYYLPFTVAAFLGNASRVAEIFRAPDLNAALFFGFFMVTDPPTSPPRPRDQVVFGIITGVFGYLFFEFVGAVYYLLAGLLVANLWEAWRRRRAHSDRARLRHHDESRPGPRNTEGASEVPSRKLIGQEADRMRAAFGAGVVMEIRGLDQRVQARRISDTDLQFFLPYSMTLRTGNAP